MALNQAKPKKDQAGKIRPFSTASVFFLAWDQFPAEHVSNEPATKTFQQCLPVPAALRRALPFSASPRPPYTFFPSDVVPKATLVPGHESFYETCRPDSGLRLGGYGPRGPRGPRGPLGFGLQAHPPLKSLERGIRASLGGECEFRKGFVILISRGFKHRVSAL